MLWIFAFVMQTPELSIVRSGQLDIRPGMEMGPVLERYTWWQEHQWQTDDQMVSFRGVIDTFKANVFFQQKNQYRLKLGMKYAQLNQRYGITVTEGAQMRWTFHFQLDGKGGFRVSSGTIAQRSNPQQPWDAVPLSDKALLQCIKATYAQQDPFTALIKGLPYK